MEVKTTGRKKSSHAICELSQTGEFKIFYNQRPLEMICDKKIIWKLQEIVQVIGEHNVKGLTFKLFTNNTGINSEVYAARQALALAILKFFGDHFDEQRKMDMKAKLLDFDKDCLVTDCRRREPKKFGGPGARARYTKSYR